MYSFERDSHHILGQPDRRPNLRRLWMIAPLLVTALGFAGCDADETNPGGAEPLRQVEIPADFTFATTRPVGLEVAASADFLGGPVALVEVKRVDGRTLYRGRLSPDRNVQVQLGLPTYQKEVVVEVATSSGRQTARVDVSSGTAAHRFE